MKSFLLPLLTLLLCGPLAAAKPEVIPELRHWTDASDGGVYALPAGAAVTVAGHDAALAAYAVRFAEELGLPVRRGRPQPGDVVLTLLEAQDGELGAEGYELAADPVNLTLTANLSLIHI